MAKKRTLKPGISPLHFFGSEVRHAREAAGMTQGELGKIANCDTSLVSRIEGGEANPSLGFPEACDAAFPHMNGFYTRFWTEHQDWPGGMFPQWADPWITSEGPGKSCMISSCTSPKCRAGSCVKLSWGRHSRTGPS